MSIEQKTQPYRPLFLVFDGMDGSGKTTQLRLLAERLRAEHVPVVVTAEPTDSPDGRRLRQALAGNIPVGMEEMAAMFLLDRIGHNQAADGIQACLQAGSTVLCDRYYYASVAYQGGDDSARRAWVTRMNLDCPAILRPDACFLFDVEPETAMQRIARRTGTPAEIYETLAQQTRIRERFRRVQEALAQRDHIITVRADGSPAEIGQRVYDLWRRLATGTESETPCPNGFYRPDAGKT